MDGIARIHLDPIGGIAGDMFAAAMADAFPEKAEGLMAELSKLGLSCAFPAHSDGFLRGHRFSVEGEHDGHGHVRYRDLQSRLRSAGLEADVLRHTLALFDLLAKAEAEVHGVPPEEVEFHEVGADDSIADFVAAGYFIAKLAPARWTLGALPLGGGRVKTAHGVLPVPAPATAILMKGLEVIDDGVGGERVTPTGAAIATYVRSLGAQVSSRTGVLAATGHGFGTRTLPGIPNMLRCVTFVQPGTDHVFAKSGSVPGLTEEIATLEFEIDDQTAEDLAVALDRVRAAPGVLDVSQFAAYGKKGRLATHVQVLARPEVVDAVADLCIAQTTTLGIRIARAWRRTALRTQVDADGVRVKIALRPDGQMTAKAEMDDVAAAGETREQREEARRRAEQDALDPRD